MLRRAAVVPLLLAACSTRSLDYAQLDAALAAARCTRLVTCGVFPDAASCATYFGDVHDADVAAALAAGSLRYHGDLAQACVDATAAMTCDTTAHVVRARPEACTLVFEGTLDVGATCNFDDECRSRRCVLAADTVCQEGACCPGTCGTYARAQLGEACARTIDCNEGSFCTNDHVCRALGDDGASCTTDAQCAAGLACSLGACRAAPALGEACPFGRCADLGATCDATGTCVALGAVGAACTDDSQCSPYGACTDQRCALAPTLGHACTLRCAAGAWCDTTTHSCVMPHENGDTCEANNQCITSYCRFGDIINVCADAPTCI